MDLIQVTGGQRLVGEIEVSGAKNAVLPLLCACLLAQGEYEFTNVVPLGDVLNLLKIMADVGVEHKWTSDTSLKINVPAEIEPFASYELVKKMRASVLVLGPFLARYGHAKVSLPGGCAIGARPVDIHLNGLKDLQAEIEIEDGYINATAANGLQGADIELPFPSVGATENLMMAAVLADGVTTISNAACEPEITDLALMLNNMGGKVENAGTHIIKITGVKQLKAVNHKVVGDRIEAGTFAIAAAITKGDLLLKNANWEHLGAFFTRLQKAGVECTIENESDIRVRYTGQIHAVDVDTSPYPGFPTDLQAQFMTLMCLADGVSTIRENIFENRFMHVPELQRLGTNIDVKGNIAIVHGVDKFKGAQVKATDLRASVSLILAGLCAEDQVTTVSHVYHLDRGYYNLEEKLGKCGANIVRIQSTDEPKV